MANSNSSSQSSALKSAYLKTFRLRSNSVIAYEATNVISTDRTYIPQITVDESDITPFTRARAQTLARILDNNFPLVTALLNQTVSYGIGDGISIQATTPNADFNKSVTDWYERWATSQFSTVTQEHNQYQQQKVTLRTKARDGEMFILMVRDMENPVFKCQTQMIMPDQIMGDPNNKDDTSQDGVFFDDYNRAIAYGVSTKDGWQRVDASNVIHFKGIGKGARQNRGISELVSGINDARDHRDLIRLEKQAAKNHSAIARVVTKITGEAGKGTNAGLKPNPYTASPTGQLPTRPVPGNAFGVERGFGSVTQYLSPGEKLELVTSGRASVAFTGFIDHLMRQVCLSVGLPFEFVVNPEKLNGTSMRFIIEHAATYFHQQQSELIEQVLKRLYGWAISCAIKDGFIIVPDELKNSPDIYSCSFTRPKSITVDAGRVTNAEVLLIENRLASYDGFFSARGKNWEHEFRQQDAERERLIRSWVRETLLLIDLCKQTNGIITNIPTIPFPFGSTAPNPSMPGPVVKATPEDVEEAEPEASDQN